MMFSSVGKGELQFSVYVCHRFRPLRAPFVPFSELVPSNQRLSLIDFILSRNRAVLQLGPTSCPRCWVEAIEAPNGAETGKERRH